MGLLDGDIADEFTSMLEVGERIVLGDVGIDWPERRRLLLTNRRLVLFQGEGLLRRQYVKEREY